MSTAILEVTLYDEAVEAMKRLREPKRIPGTDIQLCAQRRWERATRMASWHAGDERYESKMRELEKELDSLQRQWDTARDKWLESLPAGEPIPYISDKCECDGCQMYDAMEEIEDLVESLFVRNDFVELVEKQEQGTHLQAIYVAMKKYKDKAERFGVPVNMYSAVYGGWHNGE